jgi:copper(I)-binding protein
MHAAQRNIGAGLLTETNTHHVTELNGIRVAHAWSRATSGPSAEVFMDITSRLRADVLLGASTAIAATAVLEGAYLKDGEVATAPLASLELPVGATFTLSPNVVFLHLTGLREPLALGDEYRLKLSFATAGEIEIYVQVQAADATQHSHAGHGS